MSTEVRGSPGIANAPRGTPTRRSEIGHIAQAAIQLAALSPRLKAIAEGLEKNSMAQAESAAIMAQSAEDLVNKLGQAMSEVTSSSGQVEKTLALVKKVSDQTQLLSINARIEAARAAEAGRAFAVVVEAMSQLANDTGRMTAAIGGHIGTMKLSVDAVAAMTGLGEGDGKSSGTAIREVNRQVREMAAAAQRQLGEAQAVHAMGARINSLTEALLFQVGRFRYEAHDHAREALDELLPELAAAGNSRTPCEEALERWLRRHSYFELAYAADTQGRQFVDNIGWTDGRVAHHPSGYGQDWSSRPWFSAALENEGVFVTDIYRSAATGDYCFTVSAALRWSGRVQVVVGADVNFQRMSAL